MERFAEAVQHVVCSHTPLSCFLSSFLIRIDLPYFSLCTPSHYTGHFLRLILNPCLVIRDNCQLSQGTVRSIPPKSMQSLGLYCFFSFSKRTTWSGERIACKCKDEHEAFKMFQGYVALLENRCRHQMRLLLLLCYNI